VQTLLTVLTQKSRSRQALKMLASAQLDPTGLRGSRSLPCW